MNTHLAQSKEFNILEQFLDVHLYQFGFPRVGQNLEQILVRDEVESREHVSFRFQILFQGSLHRLEFAADFIQKLEQAGWSGNEEKEKKGNWAEAKKKMQMLPDLHYFSPPSFFLFHVEPSRRTFSPPSLNYNVIFSPFEIFIYTCSFERKTNDSENKYYKQDKIFFFFEKILKN